MPACHVVLSFARGKRGPDYACDARHSTQGPESELPSRPEYHRLVLASSPHQRVRQSGVWVQHIASLIHQLITMLSLNRPSQYFTCRTHPSYRYADKFAKLAGPLQGSHVIEVGSGPGGLTRSILMVSTYISLLWTYCLAVSMYDGSFVKKASVLQDLVQMP